MNMNMTMNMNMNMTMNRTNGGISNTVEQLTMNTQETTMKNNDSRVSVLPVKDEWCTGRGYTAPHSQGVAGRRYIRE
jgi:hypothetical protein